MMKKTKNLITSALPYINGTKHLGNMAGSLLPADVYSRYLRQNCEQVLFICGTDDHGTATEIAAQQAGLSPAEYTKKMHSIQADIYSRFGLSFDYFGNSSSLQNIELTQHFAARAHNNGFTEIQTTRQFYSVADQRFLPDRYIIGTCPHCGYDKARGDQCENCTQVLDPIDLINPRSTISGSTNLEMRDTRHLFLRLSLLADDVRRWIDTRCEWSPLVKSIAYKWLNEGLQDRCITRDLEWGVPCNIDSLTDKVFYVWFDAPIGYIAATKEWAEQAPNDRDWQKYWWNADDTVHYTQFMAKDNVPFHTIIFPASIEATKEPWKRVDYLKGFSWLTYYGGKFSTSQNIGVFTDDALEILPADYWRYYLIARAPESADASFTWEDFQQIVNKDLVGIIGNSVNRLMKLADSQFGGDIPAACPRGPIENNYTDKLQKNLSLYNQELDALNFRRALEALRTMWACVNEYLTEAAPWTTLKNDQSAAAGQINFAFNMIAALAPLSKPIIPFVAERIESALGIVGGPQWHTCAESALRQLLDRKSFSNPGLLFRRIENTEIEQFREHFGAGATPALPKSPVNSKVQNA